MSYSYTVHSSSYLVQYSFSVCISGVSLKSFRRKSKVRQGHLRGYRQ